MNLVTVLKAQHDRLTAMMKTIEESGISTPEDRDILGYFKELLIDHLKLEDQQFYPLLEDAAKSNQSLKSVLSNYKEDFDKIVADVDKIFSTFESSVNNRSFRDSFQKFERELEEVIQKQEAVLFREYLKIEHDSFNQMM